jgi:hypothetical protein
MIRMLGRLAEVNSETTYDNFVRNFGEPFVPGYKSVLTTGVLYVGLGDQFDDDRRLVRAGAPRPPASKPD